MGNKELVRPWEYLKIFLENERLQKNIEKVIFQHALREANFFANSQAKLGVDGYDLLYASLAVETLYGCNFCLILMV